MGVLRELFLLRGEAGGEFGSIGPIREPDDVNAVLRHYFTSNNYSVRAHNRSRSRVSAVTSMQFLTFCCFVVCCQTLVLMMFAEGTKLRFFGVRFTEQFLHSAAKQQVPQTPTMVVELVRNFETTEDATRSTEEAAFDFMRGQDRTIIIQTLDLFLQQAVHQASCATAFIHEFEDWLKKWIGGRPSAAIQAEVKQLKDQQKA